MNSEPPDATNDRLLALGLVIEWSATMERQIQDAFCALAGSEFSAAVAEGQSADWLIEKCEALADAHRELPDADRQAIGDALQNCREANVRRNDLVHGVKAPSQMPTGGVKTIKNLRSTHELAARSWTIADIRAAGEALQQAGLRLAGAIQQTFPESPLYGEALGREDVRATPGRQ